MGGGVGEGGCRMLSREGVGLVLVGILDELGVEVVGVGGECVVVEIWECDVGVYLDGGVYEFGGGR